MFARINTMGVLALVLIVGLIATVTYQAGAMRGGMAAPTSVAVVDLAAVIEGLDQRIDSERSLQEMGQSVQQEFDDRVAALETMRADIQEMPEGPGRDTELEKLELELLRVESWKQAQRAVLDADRALLFQDLFRTVKAAAEDMAQTRGFDIVVVDDSNRELTFSGSAQISRSEQVQQQLAARRLLHTAENIDITRDLVERMNNLYNAGQ